MPATIIIINVTNIIYFLRAFLFRLSASFNSFLPYTTFLCVSSASSTMISIASDYSFIKPATSFIIKLIF